MFEYALGVINVLEKNIFDYNDQRRMISAPDRETAFKVLFDTDMAESSVQEKEIEKILEKDLVATKEFILKTVKEEKIELFWFLFLRYDALNLKIALKERSLNEETFDTYFKHSIIDYSDVKKRLEDKKHAVKNEYVESMIERSKDLLENKEVFEIEEVVDMIFLETRLKIAEKIGSLPLMIAKLEIDIANLKNLIKEKDKFVNGGNLSREDLEELLNIDEGTFPKGLERFLEAYELSLVMKKFKETGSETTLEKELEKFIGEEILKRERDKGSGIDKIVSFFYRKINSHANIRLIFFAKESGLSIEEVENNILPIS